MINENFDKIFEKKIATGSLLSFVLDELEEEENKEESGDNSKTPKLLYSTIK